MQLCINEKTQIKDIKLNYKKDWKFKIVGQLETYKKLLLTINK